MVQENTLGGGRRRFGRWFPVEDGIQGDNEDGRRVRFERRGPQGKSRAGLYVRFVGLHRGRGGFFGCRQLNLHAKRACKRQFVNFCFDRLRSWGSRI
jgi:hypothetical protein